MSSNWPLTPGGAKMRWTMAGVSCTLPEQGAGLDLGAGGEIGRRLEAPQATAVERRNVHPARNKVASLLGVFEQGALHAVENAAEQAWPQLHG